MDTIIRSIGNTFFVSSKIYNIIGTILKALVFHRIIYFIIGLFFTRRFKPANKRHKYGDTKYL